MPIHLTDTITLYTREDWGAREPGPMDEQGWNAHEAFIHHSDDTYQGIDSLDEQIARMRGYQNYHMDVKGWSDIGYHAVVFPDFTTGSGTHIPARIFQGRERHYVPAAQLGHNEGTLAVCCVGKYMTETVRPNMRYALGVYLREHEELRTLGGHRDVVNTSCPGDKLYAELPRLAEVVGLRLYR